VFISGGPGSGKTALWETFVESQGGSERPLILIGRCFQQFGSSEPYMPVFEALAGAQRQHPLQAVTELLKRHADAYATTPQPTSESAAPVDLPRRDHASPQRMLRHIIDALEALSRRMGWSIFG
jgi:hypothetical protein